MEFYYVVQSSLDLDSSELSTSASQLAWTTDIRPLPSSSQIFTVFQKCENELNKDECAMEILFPCAAEKAFLSNWLIPRKNINQSVLVHRSLPHL
jgi:hypothetical protein